MNRMGRLFLLFSLALIVALAANITAAEQDQAATARLSPEALRKAPADRRTGDLSPLYLVENKGQWQEDVFFQLGQPRYSIFFTSSGISYQFIENDGREKNSQKNLPGVTKNDDSPVRLDHFFVRFAGASENLKIEGRDENKTKFSYIRGRDASRWVRGARTYRKLVYRDLYPHVDLVIHGNGAAIKNDYVVQPGGNVGRIRLKYEGVRSLRVNPEGQLELTTERGRILDEKPYSYQIIDGERVEVPARYRLQQGRIVGFDVGEYRKDLDLVIDPVIYSTYLGGIGEDDNYEGIVIDAAGNAYVTGMTISSDFPATVGAYDTSPNGNWDIFVTKVSPTGTDLVFSTFLGGMMNDDGDGIAIDAEGSVYVTGDTWSTDLPVTGGVYDCTYNTNGDVFVAKIDSLGENLLYLTYLGGTGNEYGDGLTVDASGNAYVTGYTTSTDFPTSGGAYDTTHNGSADVFVTKIDATAQNILYSTFLGHSGDEVGFSIVLDAANHAVVTGYTTSAGFPTVPGSYDTTYNGGTYDAFVFKIDGAGTGLSFSTFLGESGDDLAWKTRLDKSGNVYVGGYTNSTAFPTTPGAYDTTYNGSGSDSDAFLVKLPPSGQTLLFSTLLGGTGYDACLGLDIDIYGNAYLAGPTSSTDFPVTADAEASSYYGGNRDGFGAIINSAGQVLVYSTYFGSDGADWPYGVAIDSVGSIFLAGNTDSTYFADPGSYDETYNGNGDTFAIRAFVSVQLPVFDGHNFDGSPDGDSDVAIFRPADGMWYVKDGATVQFGAGGDIPVNGYYDAGLTADIAVWRPAIGMWYIKDIASHQWGIPGDIPVPGDYNGDGLTDIAVWRPTNGIWYIKDIGSYQFGSPGDIPVPGDYDGDNVTEIAVFRPANGVWYVKDVGDFQWGMAGDLPLPGDYDGDGTTDMAIFRPGDGLWYLRNIGTYPWGIAGDVPVPGRFDANASTDIAVWRPSNGVWYVRNIADYQWGSPGDIPLVR